VREVQNIRPVRLLAPGGVLGREMQTPCHRKRGWLRLERTAYPHGPSVPLMLPDAVRDRRSPRLQGCVVWLRAELGSVRRRVGRAAARRVLEPLARSSTRSLPPFERRASVQPVFQSYFSAGLLMGGSGSAFFLGTVRT